MAFPKITSIKDAYKATRKISGDLNQIAHELHNLGQDEEAEKVAKFRDKFTELANELHEESNI